MNRRLGLNVDYHALSPGAREALRRQGARRSHELTDLPIPDRFTWLPQDFPRGDPFNVGQMYALFAEAIRTGKARQRLPTFDTAVDLHRFLDTIRQSSDKGRELTVPSAHA